MRQRSIASLIEIGALGRSERLRTIGNHLRSASPVFRLLVMLTFIKLLLAYSGFQAGVNREISILLLLLLLLLRSGELTQE